MMQVNPTPLPQFEHLNIEPGVHVPITVDAAVVAKEVATLEEELDEIRSELSDVQNRIDDLEADRDYFEDEERRLEHKIEQLRKGGTPSMFCTVARFAAMDGQQTFGCIDCAWFTSDDSAASRWRAEEHASYEGHRIALVMPGGSILFEQDRLELEVGHGC